MGRTGRKMRFGAAAVLATGLAYAAAQNPGGPQATANARESAANAASGAELRPAAWQGTDALVKDDLFTGTEKFAKNASDVTEVTMDPDTLDMVNGNGAKRAHNMILNVVRTYSYDKPGMYRLEDVEEFRRKLNTGDWHCSVHTRDLKTGESTDICNRRRTDGMKESAIITVEPKELTFIHTIRKGGPGESSLGPESVWELGVPNSLPPAAMIAMMQPEVNAEMSAEMQAQSAELQGQSAEMLPGLPTLPAVDLNEPQLREQMGQLQRQLRDLPRQELKPFRSDEMQQLQEQLKQLEKMARP